MRNLERADNKAGVHFLEDCEVTPHDGAEEVVVPEPVKRVKVLSPYSVAHDGTAYWPNAVAEVPQSIASKWITQKWVVSEDGDEVADAEVVDDVVDAEDEVPAPRRRVPRK